MPIFHRYFGRPFNTLFERLRDFALGAHRRAAVLLILLALLAFLPGFFVIPPVDRDETRFAQASRQMVETGDFIDIRLLDMPRHKKPIGIYWAQSAAVMMSGLGGDAPIWVYRLPSLFGALAVVLLTYWVALPLGRQTALAAAAMMAIAPLLGVEARLATTDALLAACIVFCQSVLFRTFRHISVSWPLAMAFWVAFGAGILIKGPVLPLIVLSTIIAATLIHRNVQWLQALHPLVGVCMTLAITAPWFILIALKTGGTFFDASLQHDAFGKVFAGRESHGAPPGFHALLFTGTFWPFSVITIAALPAIWQARHDRNIQFLLCWLVPNWLIFELVATKLPHYVLPLMPAIAIATAQMIVTGRFTPRRPFPYIMAFVLILTSLLALAAFVAGLTLSIPRAMPALFIGAGLCTAAMAAGIGLLQNRTNLIARPGAFLGVLATILIGFYVLLFQALLPNVPQIWLSNRLADAAARGCDNPEIRSVGYLDISLPFLTRSDLRFETSAGAARFLAEGGCRIAFVIAAEQAAFEAAGGGEADEVIAGFNVGIGRETTVYLYRAKTPGAVPSVGGAGDK